MSPRIDLVRLLEQQGHLTAVEAWDQREHRMQMQAEIAPAGRRRMDQLVRDDVKPSPGSL